MGEAEEGKTSSSRVLHWVIGEGIKRGKKVGGGHEQEKKKSSVRSRNLYLRGGKIERDKLRLSPNE